MGYNSDSRQMSRYEIKKVVYSEASNEWSGDTANRMEESPCASHKELASRMSKKLPNLNIKNKPQTFHN